MSPIIITTEEWPSMITTESLKMVRFIPNSKQLLVDKLKLCAQNDSSASEHSEEIKDEEKEGGNYSLDK